MGAAPQIGNRGGLFEYGASARMHGGRDSRVFCDVFELGGHHASSFVCARDLCLAGRADPGHCLNSVGPRRSASNSTRPRRDMAPTQTGAESFATAARRPIHYLATMGTLLQVDEIDHDDAAMLRNRS